ncbi:hypothetical protein HW260_00650 [Helicobacter cinaedi]|uniref:Methyltransferase n=1 Tax=Helicobacter cinaedi CCUG 18818 = ATCC BAA-847 TaxID=537971 RepID=A0AAI8MPA1_9HELI
MCKYDINLLRKLDRIHPYPAKFIIDIALHYISNYSKQGDIVLDPFCGSGTTLLASRILKRNAIGFDINYIAYILSQSKILYLNVNDLKYLKEFQPDSSYIANILHNYDNISHWFERQSIESLSSIKEQINNFVENNHSYKIFLYMVFSSIINIASNQDSDTRYAAIKKPHINKSFIFDKFNEKLHQSIALYENLNLNDNHCAMFLHNSKTLTKKFNSEVSLILTSPPYPNTYDYYLYHKHRMLWLDFNVKFSMDNEIGSRREYSSLKLPKEKFNKDLFEIFFECNKILKRHGFVVIIMGDGKIAGKIYHAKDELVSLCEVFQWKLIKHSYSELDKTSRSFSSAFRTKNKKEHILIFQKA